jgi:hypothetical protein
MKKRNSRYLVFNIFPHFTHYKIEVDWFLRRYGVAFLSADSIYLSDVLSIENAPDN